jgi:hypothetical protein
MSRKSPWTNYVYRVNIEHLHADGIGHYMLSTYGPYTTLAAAKAQETRLLGMARHGGKKAKSFIEEAWVEWELHS